MDEKKVKNLDNKEYQEFIKELIGEDLIDILEPQKKD